jgi:hypothetical protein
VGSNPNGGMELYIFNNFIV